MTGSLPALLLALAASRHASPCGVRTTDLRIGPATIHVESCGSGPAVVLIHGGNTDRRMWDREFAAWSGTHRVVRYDVRGFGRSTRPAGPYASHDDLLVVLDSLGIDRAVLVGLSLGGRIAVDFALTHPERVRGLVLAGPGLSGFPWSRQQEAVWTRIGEAVRRKDGRAAARLWLETGYMRPAMEHAALRPLLRRLTEENAASWTVPDEEAELEPPAYDRLGSIQAPARIIVGARDIPDIHRIVDRLASGIPGATRVVVPRAGHMVNLEAPEAFERAVLPFIDSLPPSAAR